MPTGHRRTAGSPVPGWWGGLPCPGLASGLPRSPWGRACGPYMLAALLFNAVLCTAFLRGALLCCAMICTASGVTLNESHPGYSLYPCRLFRLSPLWLPRHLAGHGAGGMSPVPSSQHPSRGRTPQALIASFHPIAVGAGWILCAPPRSRVTCRCRGLCLQIVKGAAVAVRPLPLSCCIPFALLSCPVG